MVALAVPVSLAALAGVGEPPTPLAVAEPTHASPAGDPAAAVALSCSGAASPAEVVPATNAVVAARMCDTDSGVAAWFAPQDGLHEGLEPLLAVLTDAEAVPETSGSGDRYFCTDDGGYGFDLRLALGSGEVVSIPGDTGGCSTVRIGGADLVGSDEVLATFLEALDAQRADARPPAAVEPLDLGCRNAEPPVDHRLSLIGDPSDLVSAVTCWRPDADETPPWRDRKQVPVRALAVLVDDLTASSRLAGGFGEPSCPDGYYTQDLVGLTRRGDVVAVRGVCREFLTTPPRFIATGTTDVDLELPYWTPSPRAQRILDGLRR
ncbi:hypothetical protein CXG46_03440 [Nocardioides alpinus]|uniref:Uncharacterized protein n=1 Tax=Nocardioides alpinus TaxID=748909 RepID=A0ABX4R0I8_9ACTN|nr:hypothetical protein CXG46_03440 [Nocardioides alpinus]